MTDKLKRPGGELASRPLHFFWIVDCSGSMDGDKIQSLNYAIRQAIPEMRSAADENPNAQLLIRTLVFSSGARWVNLTPIPISDFEWNDLSAEGVTDMGKAFSLLSEQLQIPPMPERALPPVLVLLSDGQPTDDYRTQLNLLNQLNWTKKAAKIAISIGQDSEMSVLEEFTGNRELVLQANNPQALTKMIKWASTVAKVVSAPASQRAGEPPVLIDTNLIPVADTDPDVW